MKIPEKEFYMIRHPQSVANAGGYFSGQLDVAITSFGIEQVNGVKGIIASVKDSLSYIFHSDLQRTKFAALMINEDLELPVFETELLAEQNYGDWQGKPKAEVGPDFQASVNPPNGETREDFIARVQKGIVFALEQQEGTPLIVSHGGVFSSFYRMYGQEKPAPIQNCVLYKFTPAPDKTDMPWDIKTILA